MARYIDHETLPVGISYCGLIGADYVISIDTSRKSWLGFLGDEKIEIIEFVAISKQEAKKSSYVDFPIQSIPKSEIRYLQQNSSLSEIYRIWEKLRLPMPILGRATIENWPNIPKDSILLPINARRYNSDLRR